MNPFKATHSLKAFLILLSIFASPWTFAEGGTQVGGGGDQGEERFDEIRKDILDWIDKGGGQALKFNGDMHYDEYRAGMSEVLAPRFVIVTFVTQQQEEKTKDPELKVTIDGRPKTCRGFVSTRDRRMHILCQVERFRSATEAEQYRLVHHEFAGLHGIEKNLGAASDYEISNQITSYLVVERVLRLAVKAPASIGGPFPGDYYVYKSPFAYWLSRGPSWDVKSGYRKLILGLPEFILLRHELDKFLIFKDESDRKSFYEWLAEDFNAPTYFPPDYKPIATVLNDLKAKVEPFQFPRVRAAVLKHLGQIQSWSPSLAGADLGDLMPIKIRPYDRLLDSCRPGSPDCLQCKIVCLGIDGRVQSDGSRSGSGGGWVNNIHNHYDFVIGTHYIELPFTVNASSAENAVRYFSGQCQQRSQAAARQALAVGYPGGSVSGRLQLEDGMTENVADKITRGEYNFVLRGFDKKARMENYFPEIRDESQLDSKLFPQAASFCKRAH